MKLLMAILAAATVALASPAHAGRVGGPPSTPEEAGIVVDSVRAAVNGTPITASDVELERSIRERIAASPSRAEFGRLLTEQVDPLEAIIFRVILLGLPEARTLPVSGDRGQERLRLFDATFGSREAAAQWRVSWGLERPALLDWFQESVLLDELVELSVDVDVTEEQQRSYWEQHRDQVYGGRPYEDVSSDVAQRVFVLQFEDEYNSFRKALRSRAQLRYVGRR